MRWTSVGVIGSATILSSAVGQGHPTSDNNTRRPAPSTTNGPSAGRGGVRMQAIVLRELGGPEQLRLETVPDPQPGPGEVVVRLYAAALNHRDVWIRKGLYAGIKLPIILGSDGAGEVSAVGVGADPSLLGRQVVMNPGIDWGEDERVQGA